MLIDTHAAVRDLTSGGEFTESQAEKIVARASCHTPRGAVSRADDKVATKQDLKLLRKELKSFVWKAAVAQGTFVAALLAVFEFLV